MEQIIATYDYRDRYGNLLFQVVRYDPKDFRQRRIVEGEWVWGRGDIPPVPYRLPELIRSRNRVIVVEGEKDVERLIPLLPEGTAATTTPGGANNWKADFAQYFQGVGEVVIIPDNDDAGLAYARTVAYSLKDTVSSIRIVQLIGLPQHGDVSDYLREHTYMDLLWDIEMTPITHTFLIDTANIEKHIRNPHISRTTSTNSYNDFKEATVINCVSIMSNYVELKRDSSNRMSYRCPFHNDTEASGKLYTSTGKWWCFGCGRGGTVIGFVMEVTGQTFGQVRDDLSTYLGVGRC